MEMTKHLCVMLAAAGLFACSNEDVPVNNNAPVAIEGPAALTIQINNPGMSRTTTDGTTGENEAKAAITVKNLIVKYLPSGTYAKLEGLTLTGSQEQVLYDVPEGTTGFVVVGNSLAETAGDAAFSSTSDAETNTKSDKSAAAATVYGMTNTLTPSGNVIKGTGGANGGQANTSYSEYKATVTVSPVTARMEISGLKFVPKETGSDFTSLTLEGVFLNDYYNTGTFKTSVSASVEVSNPVSLDENPNITDPKKPEDALSSTFALADWFTTSTGSDETGVTFYDGSSTPTLPSENNVWAYNFFVSTTAEDTHSLPKFTVVVNPTYTQGKDYGKPLYAVISQYKDSEGSNIDKFEAGKIYKITSLELPEDVLTPDINGNQTIAITATVTVTPWTIKQTTGVWAGREQTAKL